MDIFAAFPDLRGAIVNRFLPAYCAKPAIMIAMTPRTGSTHLCAALGADGNFGDPDEIFNPRGPIGLAKRQRNAATFAAYVNTFNRAPGKYFCFKTSWQDFAPVAGIYQMIFPDLKIVYLDRRDVVAQAVSLFRASVTGKWHERRTAPPEPAGDIRAKFDLVGICRMIEKIDAEKAGWHDFFFAEALNPPRLDYENFADDVSRATAFIGERLGIPIIWPVPPEIGFRKLADNVSDEWVKIVKFYRSGAFYQQAEKYVQIGTAP